MKVLVIGGTGHIGSYLVPRLTQANHEVMVVARRPQPQYADSRLGWSNVEWVVTDRGLEEASGACAQRMAATDADIVMDLLCYSIEQQQMMYDAFRGRVRHFLHCGTVWAYGPAQRVPYDESYPRRPITDYGRKKAQIEAFLLQRWQDEGFPATCIHPGHISGRRWLPIDPQGSRDGVAIYERLATGQEVWLPDQGTATIHHVHGDDVAQLFQLAMEQRERALGESFSAVAPYALSLNACCRSVAALFGREPNLRYVPLPQMAEKVGAQSFRVIAEHVTHSPCASIAKGQALLGYHPRYVTEQIYAQSIEYLLESNQLKLA